MTIAFFGLGNMGAPMALNLHQGGQSVRGFDLSESARQQAAGNGLPVAESLTDALEGADTVISMLPAGQHVEALYLGRDGTPGLLETLPQGALVIDCSTIATTSSRTLAETATTRDIDILDAPVSGGTAGAAAGTLTFLVGGSDQALKRARPLLELMGQTIFHAGAAGAGQTAKICNNMLLGILMTGTAEALNLGRANGLDPSVLSEIMRRSSGGNWALEKYNPLPGVMDNVPAARGYSGGFGTDLMLKDLGLAQENALNNRATTPLGALARQLYALHSSHGHGQLDFSSIIELLHPTAD